MRSANVENTPCSHGLQIFCQFNWKQPQLVGPITAGFNGSLHVKTFCSKVHGSIMLYKDMTYKPITSPNVKSVENMSIRIRAIYASG